MMGVIRGTMRSICSGLLSGFDLASLYQFLVESQYRKSPEFSDKLSRR
jgi:hypothetical protein